MAQLTTLGWRRTLAAAALVVLCAACAAGCGASAGESKNDVAVAQAESGDNTINEQAIRDQLEKTLAIETDGSFYLDGEQDEDNDVDCYVETGEEAAESADEEPDNLLYSPDEKSFVHVFEFPGVALADCMTAVRAALSW